MVKPILLSYAMWPVGVVGSDNYQDDTDSDNTIFNGEENSDENKKEDFVI
jgi:hypothetical protein